MNSTNSNPAAFVIPGEAPSAARVLLKTLLRLRHGTLTVKLPDGSVQRFGSGEAPTASLHLLNWHVCAATLKSGDIGFAESYMAGDWTTPHLAELLRIFLINRKEIEDVIYGTWLGRLVYRFKHLLNRNTRANSQKNIQAHYDLGNAFYALWLDATMNYSSALFEVDNASLAEAQQAKVQRALRMARVGPGMRVLEIGCGWGALAESAAGEFGASVVGLTLSAEQLAFAQQRIDRAGLTAQVELRLQDYRDIEPTSSDGRFDAVCSIEMVEAVGREYWNDYFQTISRQLKPGAYACIQSIVIADRLAERYRSSTDFIQQYVFPGGYLPSPTEFRAQVAQAGLELVDEFAFGQDYARTLQSWREQFVAQAGQVLQLGYDRRFLRLWEFYLAYCEAAFREANTDVVQYTLRKPAGSADA